MKIENLDERIRLSLHLPGFAKVHLPAMCSWTFNTYVTYHALTYHEPLADCEYILNLFLLFPENVKEIRLPSGLHNLNLFAVLKKDLFEPGF